MSHETDEMGISRQNLWGKITNKVKFTPDEQQYLVERLDIRTMKEFRDIFFSNEVEKKRTLEAVMFVKVSEFAEIMGISTVSVYRLIESDSIPYYRVGKSIRLNIDDFRKGKEKGYEELQIEG